MKKLKLLVLAGLMLFAMPAKADLAPTVMLHHGGQVKTYMYYEVQKAVDDAVDGDTIFLSNGSFQPFNVNKRILVKGAGYSTLIDGSCVIDIPGTDKLNMPVLDALTFNGDIQVNNAYKQFTLRKCSMINLIFSEEGGKEFYDVKIDRCEIKSRLNLPNNVIEFNAFNSKIYTFYPHDYSGYSMFEHCNIGNTCAHITGGIFNSCVIGPATKFSDAKDYSNMIGCVLNSCYYCSYNQPLLNCTVVNCRYSISSTNYYNEFYNFNDDAQSYVSALDGTKMGAYGGQHPFNRNPEAPGVTKHEISIDAATRTMTVKLTVDKLDK